MRPVAWPYSPTNDRGGDGMPDGCRWPVVALLAGARTKFFFHAQSPCLRDGPACACRERMTPWSVSANIFLGKVMGDVTDPLRNR